jgi:hypothetical protein
MGFGNIQIILKMIIFGASDLHSDNFSFKELFNSKYKVNGYFNINNNIYNYYNHHLLQLL